jgi:uncharacterized glyoxalase superfamily protein PhnB
MTEAQPRSAASEVEVALDPREAFDVFTDEMDLWWVRSPISFFDSARAVAQRCERGIGGRLLEIYDEATGDALELGRITVWEPGARLGWQSAVDDVIVDVTFRETAAGRTTVRVEARIPAGGKDMGGTAWVRVGPPWFGAWCARRMRAPHEVRDLARLAVAVYYAKPGAAARWLADVFGFDLVGDVPGHDDDPPWTEFHIGDAALLLFKRDEPMGEGFLPTHIPWVFVDDVEAHCARAAAHGATIVEPIHQHGYRAYVAEDLEGHRWTFAQARPTMH